MKHDERFIKRKKNHATSCSLHKTSRAFLSNHNFTLSINLSNSPICCLANEDPCYSDPCQNGGTCNPLAFNVDFECFCTDEFQGRLCNVSSLSMKKGMLFYLTLLL